MAALRFGDVVATHVSYLDVPVDADTLALPAEAVEGGAAPWVAGGRPVAGVGLWVLDVGGTTIVVDPVGAVDDLLRSGPDAVTHQEAVFARMAEVDIEPSDVDLVVLTHLDGIGLVAAVDEAGAWVPAFPNACVVLPQRELDALAPCADGEVQGLGALRVLLARGVVDGVADGWSPAPGVRLEHTGGHGAGHAVVRLGDGSAQAVMVGHLALSPLHLALGAGNTNHEDPAVAQAVVEALVAESAAEGTVLIGPLWPSPGACRTDAAGVPTAV